MPSLKKSAILQRKDLIAVLNINHHIQNGSTLDDLKSFLHSKVLPILDSKSPCVCWIHPHSFSGMEANPSYISETSCDDLEKQFSFCRVSGKICFESCPFKEIEVKDSGKNLLEPMAKVLRKNLSKLPKGHPCWECIHIALNELGQSESTSGVGFMRLVPRDKFWTLRDKGILDLVWPHFLQAIRTVFHEKSLVKEKVASLALNDIPTPVAFLTNDFSILFRNWAFDDVFPLKAQETFPDVLFDLLQREIENSSKSGTNNISLVLKIPDCATRKGFFRLNLNRLDNSKGRESGHWILRMEPLGESGHKIDRLIKKNLLSKREKEICDLILEGKSNNEIASRLFISYHTTRNHLQKIHKKLGVRTRSELMALFRP